MAEPVPFRVHFPDSMLEDLRERLSKVRWPDEPPLEPWSTGTSVAYLKQLVAYWREQFDWRAQEAALNTFQHYKVALGGIELHYIHEQGRGPAPIPLLLSHGWPGSIAEFLKIIPMLTDPARFGADPRDAFTVVAPSLPGYTFSFRPGQPRFSVEQIADLFAQLMSEVLGFKRFAAQGGDWGAFVTSRLGLQYADRLYGIHLNMLAIRRDPKMLSDPSPEEQVFLRELEYWIKEEMGYQWIQGTQPQTLAFGLSDSPVGLAAWLLEKFRKWSDCGGDPESVFSKDELLTNITIYWVTQTIQSSIYGYLAETRRPSLAPGDFVDRPVGLALFPRDAVGPPPRRLAERSLNVVHWTEMASGGHFGAWERPREFAADLRNFYATLEGLQFTPAYHEHQRPSL